MDGLQLGAYGSHCLEPPTGNHLRYWTESLPPGQSSLTCQLPLVAECNDQTCSTIISRWRGQRAALNMFLSPIKTDVVYEPKCGTARGHARHNARPWHTARSRQLWHRLLVWACNNGELRGLVAWRLSLLVIRDET